MQYKDSQVETHEAPNRTRPEFALDVRSNFELWASDEGRFPSAVERSGDEYLLASTQMYWLAWQGAVDAVESKQKDYVEHLKLKVAEHAACILDSDALIDKLRERISDLQLEAIQKQSEQRKRIRDLEGQRFKQNGVELELVGGIQQISGLDGGKAVDVWADLPIGTELYALTRSTGESIVDKRQDVIGRKEPFSLAARDVHRERARQIAEEGWTNEHDDHHRSGELALAAGCYAITCGHPFDCDLEPNIPEFWPWDPSWWKPETPRKSLVKAAALILAEIERLDRSAPPAPEPAV